MEKRTCGCGLRPKSKDEKNAELRKDAAGIVAAMEGYSSADHTRKAAEVKAAFPPVAKTAAKKPAAKKTTAKAAAKPAAKAKPAPKTVARAASKHPAPAGMSTGSHSGDVC
jgi:hypothetical protein